ncbi:MAG: hypothetical protein J07HQW1_01454 [Haloquadratum walsbyi J07HQW1]|uniref:Uncharacterized protein n=1 Tax=Haloquadratum walsbyi J07HQW1 TaxID=1238424 RepID=U1N4D9_9EURY|nr:MAG: hypothetical protein J07HQW1_01454 [Haloquadratum walsbyi J07HQW1]
MNSAEFPRSGLPVEHLFIIGEGFAYLYFRVGFSAQRGYSSS